MTKRNWKKLLKESHPDMGGDEEKFKQISAAYSKWQEERKVTAQIRRLQQKSVWSEPFQTGRHINCWA